MIFHKSLEANYVVSSFIIHAEWQPWMHR